jgi:hypothetical protein
LNNDNKPLNNDNNSLNNDKKLLSNDNEPFNNDNKPLNNDDNVISELTEEPLRFANNDSIRCDGDNIDTNNLISFVTKKNKKRKKKKIEIT